MTGKYSNPINRWEGIGPYYAMFPITFAHSIITKYTKAGDSILDPFSGRGTSIFAAATSNRHGIGIEINPVGWLYTKTKLSPANQKDVIKRLLYLDKISYRYRKEAKAMPTFFRHCYHLDVLQFLLAARKNLNWQSSKSDTTLMSLILVNLHGKYGNALSNQMRQTKSMSPQYSVHWWKKKGIKPPKINAKEFLLKKIEWRYRCGLPSLEKSVIILGDSSKALSKVEKKIKQDGISRPRLLFTSPPYLGVTDYHYDQWLRLWMLGYPSTPTTLKDRYRKKFKDVNDYSALLKCVFEKSALLLQPDATIYVRTDQRKDTYQITKKALLKAFPHKKLIEKKQKFSRPTQTHLFIKKSSKKKIPIVVGGEIDLIMVPV